MATLTSAVVFGGEGMFAQTVSRNEYWLFHEYSLAALGIAWFSASGEGQELVEQVMILTGGP
ncbi:MAG: hypothetical protein NUV50_07425 [Rhodospirillales bacterium]|nr:hypothetical protein [Rhodospirillales bacterium]